MASGSKISSYAIAENPDGDDLLLGNEVNDSTQTTKLFQISDVLSLYTIQSGNAPGSASASKDAGTESYDSSYFYVTTAQNTNRRVPINTWPHGKAYTISNHTGTRTFDASSYTIDDLVQLLCQLIVDLKALKYLE